MYKHGTHFVFPEALLKSFLPVGADWFVEKAFRKAKEHPAECKATRLDIERQVSRAIADWRKPA